MAVVVGSRLVAGRAVEAEVDSIERGFVERVVRSREAVHSVAEL